MKKLAHIGIFLTALAATGGIAAQAQSAPQLKVSLDSAYLLMGKATPIHVQIIEPTSQNGSLILPKDTLADKVEILKLLDADTTDLRNGLREIKRDILIQSFDSGTYHLNPIRYLLGNDTLTSTRLALKVVPVPIDTLTNIHDFADVADVDRRFIDYLPDFLVDYGLWILGLIAVLGGGLWGWYRFFRGKRKEGKKPEKQLPPYEKAILELNALRSDKLCEQGREKEYYTRLTDILRSYLHARFGINAMEMTSTQIRHTVQANEAARPSKKFIDQVLEIADFVKFAKVRPLPEDNIQAFNAALQFVEDTKPAPEPEKTEEEADDTASDSNNPKRQ